MAKVKYKFDHESLTHRKIEYSFWGKVMRFVPILGLSLVIAVGIVLLFSTVFDSPQEKKLQRELDYAMLQLDEMNKNLDEVEAVLLSMQDRDDNIYRAIFNAEPIASSIRSAGYGGSNRYDRLKGYDNSEIVIETSQRLDQIMKSLVVQSESYDEIVKLAKNKEKLLSHVPAIQPVSNKGLKRIASGFGWRTHPIYKIRKFHWGLDFTANTGTPVYAAGAGKIVKVKKSNANYGYGNQVVIDHGFGYETLYAHLSKIEVKKGDVVKRGDVIGLVGNTGGSTAPHLHYEVHLNGKKVNPKHYFIQDLNPLEYDKMIELCQKGGQSFD